jgi:putative membrane-bound dehydrogenase-like protein
MLRLFLSLVLVVGSFAIVAAQDKPLPPAEAAATLKLPQGFKATLFAGEPDIVQPIAFTFDDRGRLWVVECHTYPNWDGDRNDRVIILEDTDGDGKHDKRTVFWDQGKNLSGIEYGFGGIWLTAVPNLIFVPDANRDDKPDGPPVVKLDGWDLKAKHNVVNGLAWAPDGWLWGLNGILSNSSVGKPGTPDDQRMKMNCGVWRYHPVTEKVEAVAHGTTNPWGLDFDEYGEAFITNCVIKHAFHVVPGAHFERMFGQDVNPRTYQLIPSIADHIHWGGGHWTESRSGAAHDAPGGGHAHSGCMIYLGENWPVVYRGRLFTCNIHGMRVNQDRLERHGSSYVAKHEPDAILSQDPWFRGLAVKYGPDGGVYVADWSDTGECHNYEVADRTNGRIFKITYGRAEPWKEDLAVRSEQGLIEATASRNAWVARHALRLLHERRHAGKLSDRALKTILNQGYDDEDNPFGEEYMTAQFVQAIHAVGGLQGKVANDLLTHEHPTLRATVLKLGGGDANTNWALLAKDHDPNVRRALLARVRASDHVGQVLPLLWANAEDAADPYMPFLIWYALEENLKSFAPDLEKHIASMKIPLVRELFARRLTEPDEKQFAENLDRLVKMVADHPSDQALQRDLAKGIFASLDGRRDIPAPRVWRAAYRALSEHDEATVRDIAVKLALVFGDDEAVRELLALIADPAKPSERRSAAVAALAQGKVAKLAPVLFTLLQDSSLQTTALRYLPTYADPQTPKVLLEKYSSFNAETRREAIATLTARTDWAKALLDAVEANHIAKTAFTAYHLQQLALLGDKAILQRTEKLFGSVRPTKEDRLAHIAEWKQKLSGEVLKQADVKHGRAIFNKTCATCHKLFDAGGAIGPELTGSQRTNLDYVLSNVLDPSAIVPRDYQMQVIETQDGRVLVGIIKAETDAVVTLQTSNALLKLAKSDIEQRTATPQSMMPEGLIQQLSFEEFRDLTAYLASPNQVEPKE